ncbi:MAG TPA: hypothetical protein VGM96_30845 [Reyranella sp.]|jgi:hypothetical protein
MSQRSVLAGLGLMMVLSACNRYGPTAMFTTPGWYLERPRLMMVAGPEIFAGPMTYDECEAKRTMLPATTASDLLCIMEKFKPGPYGPFTPSSRLPNPAS